MPIVRNRFREPRKLQAEDSLFLNLDVWRVEGVSD
ncbi:hypothetical protein ABIC60_000337 [Phyllobacterium ifriqiyense]